MSSRIIGGVITATGAGAIGIAAENIDVVVDHVDEITATVPINIAAATTVTVIGSQFDQTAVVNAGTLEYLYGDRGAWNALDYSIRHTNDIDDSVTAIHHTLGTGANQAAPGNHVHDHDDLTDVTANQHHNQVHILGTGGDHSDAPANQADGFIKRNAANAAWEEVPYGIIANTVAEGDHTHGFEVLMADGVTPPDPLTTEDETDWLYEG